MAPANILRHRPSRKHRPPLSRWLLAGVMLLTLGLGWAYPRIGFVVPLVMATAIVVSLRKGRYACGNLCPRGSFFDTFFRPLAGQRKIPAAIRRAPVRWSLFAGLMGFMALQISRNPGSALHWGHVFWLACALTTAIAVIMGFIWQARAWCAVCPIGTLAATLGRNKLPLQIAPHCTACGQCERHCPMELAITPHRGSGALSHGDCLKCARCSSVCPSSALKWTRAA